MRGKGKEDLDRENSLGKKHGRGTWLCVRGKLQTGQYFGGVNVKVSKALYSRMLVVNISDSLSDSCVIQFNADSNPLVETSHCPAESILHFFLGTQPLSLLGETM